MLFRRCGITWEALRGVLVWQPKQILFRVGDSVSRRESPRTIWSKS